MFNLVQNITSALKTYEAKATDTRMGHKDNATDYTTGISSDPENTQSPETQSYNDDSVISIKALILFLEDYIETRLSSKLKPTRERSKDDTFAPWMRQEHSNSNIESQNAAHAYAHSSDISKKQQYGKAPERDLIHGDLKDVYSLVQDLRQLQKNNVNFIKIDHDSRFLDSIYKAVNRHKPRA